MSRCVNILINFDCGVDFSNEAISADEAYRSCQQEKCENHET